MTIQKALFLLITSSFLGGSSIQAFLHTSNKVDNGFPNHIIPLSMATTVQEEESTDTDIFTINVALTREEGKNGKLEQKLSTHPTKTMLAQTLKLNLIELPCIEHATGPDLNTFHEMVGENNAPLSDYDYVVITSPESARVFHDVMSSSSSSTDDFQTKIAAVGKATKKTLVDLGYDVEFVPSKANGETLAKELPPLDGVETNRVLYPASAKADSTIKEMLEGREGEGEDGSSLFTVTRLNTYDTVPVSFSDNEMETIMDDVQLACFGSPSTVDSWIENVDRILGIQDLPDDEKKKIPGCNGNVLAVCIGSTTAKRCLESGRWDAMNIYYPKTNPGIEGWADSCYQASGDLLEDVFWS